MEYNLPRKYLSYSAFATWKSSKDSFRKKYYLNEKPFETAETIFGKKIAEMLEDDDKVVGSETRIEVALDDGLKLLGYIDSFDEETLKIVEFKTGHTQKDGKAPWDNLKVRKHKQLVFYAMLVKEKYRKHNPEVTLKWMETEFENKSFEFDGHILEGKSKALRLTGKEEVFNRTIEDWEIDKMKEEVKKVALEISNDYTEWISKQ